MATGRRAASRFPPGRAGVLRLRHRLAVATAGADLLRRKLNLLSAEQDRLERVAAQTGERWRVAAAEADRWLLRAALQSGQSGLLAAALPASAEAELTWVELMGLRFPGEPVCRLPDRSGWEAPPGGTALLVAERAHRAAVPAALRHAAATAALRRVSVEVAVTRTRVRALERHWIPTLEEMLSQARLAMAELEHGDAIRRLVATRPGRR